MRLYKDIVWSEVRNSLDQINGWKVTALVYKLVELYSRWFNKYFAIDLIRETKIQPLKHLFLDSLYPRLNEILPFPNISPHGRH